MDSNNVVPNTNSAAPTTPTTPTASMASADAAIPAMPEMPDIPTPVSPVYQPSGNPMVGATDPITMPNPPKEPDPIEEELKAPMKAAEPVPGSIGSAISMPTVQPSPLEQVGSEQLQPMGQVPNVAFNDPAAQQQAQSQTQQPVQPQAPVAKKKIDKKTLIMLCAIAGVVVIALAIVLVTQMM